MNTAYNLTDICALLVIPASVVVSCIGVRIIYRARAARIAKEKKLVIFRP